MTYIPPCKPRTHTFAKPKLTSIRHETREGVCPKHGPWSELVAVSTGVDSKTPAGQVVVREPECPKCQEERLKRFSEEMRAKLEKEHEERRRAPVQAANVPDEYIGKGFEDFEAGNEVCAETLRQSRLYAENFERIKRTGTGLFFYGSTGVGKTHLACAILQTLAKRGIQGVYAMTWEVIFNVKSSKFGENPLKPYVDAPILVLDEIGVQSGSRFEETVLYPLIDSRVAIRRPTIFISNLQPDVKDQSYKGETVRRLIGDRLWDRIQHRSIFLRLTGESHRKRFKSVDELLQTL